jgi:hypothetical protein
MKVSQSRLLKSGAIRDRVGDGAIFGSSGAGLALD